MKNPWIISYVVLGVSTLYFIMQGNNEFLIYASTLVILITLLYKLDNYFRFFSEGKWLFLIWLIMHMAGGTLYIGETRLYDYIFLPLIGEPYNVLKYDQFVHFFCYIVMTMLMYSVLIKITKSKPNKIIFSIILILAASSVGAVNEIIEFCAVIFFQSEGVGGYYNTAIDLVANVLGSIAAVFYIKYFVKNSVLK